MSNLALIPVQEKPKAALRLVGTRDLPREDWLAVRKQGIGSSDAAAAVGLNPYKSQLELWLEKLVVMATDPLDEESPAYWGKLPGLRPTFFEKQGRHPRRYSASGCLRCYFFVF